MSKPYTGSCSDNARAYHAQCEVKMPKGSALLKAAQKMGVRFPEWAIPLIKANKFSAYSYENVERRFCDRMGYTEPEMLKWIEFTFDNYKVKFYA